MFYGTDADPVSGSGITIPAGLSIPLGGTETVTTDQRKSGEPVETYKIYNAAGQLTDVYLPPVVDASSNSTAPVAPHWSYTYDEAGNALTQTDPNGHTTQFTYDEQGNRITRTLPPPDSTTPGAQEAWSYDSYGRVKTHTDFKGQVTHELYDDTATGDGRLSEEDRFDSVADYVADPSSPVEHTDYQYDSMGRQQHVLEYTGSTLNDETDYTYDPITGNIDSITSPEGTIAYTYDPATGEHLTTDTGHTHTAYGYDDQGRLTSVEMTNASESSVDQKTTYTYDNVGNLQTVTQGDDVTTTYTYDVDNRLTEELVTRTAMVNGVSTVEDVFEDKYDLNDDGLRKDVTETRYAEDATNDINDQTETAWAYDADGRLTDESLSVVDNTDGQAPPVYDDQFTFDLNGNRQQEIIDGGDTASGGATIVYTYNGDDQRLTETRTGTDAYAIHNIYDLNGSLTNVTRTGTNPETDVYTWDLRNRMTSAAVTTASGTATTGYTYDNDGVRTSEKTSAGTTYYLNDPQNPTGYTKAIEESSTAGGSPSRIFVLGLRVEGQWDAANGQQYLLIDGHGSTRGLMSQAGAVTSRYDYDAFGDALGFDENTAATPWLFGGDGLYDPSTGWTYQLARWRNGDEFTSFDSFEADPSSPASLHKYLYANADSVNGFDPSGQFTIKFGNAAHAVIGLMYQEQHPGTVINPTRLVFGLLKPDIFDVFQHQYAEIKPFTAYGITTGFLQIAAYDRAYGVNGVLQLNYTRQDSWPGGVGLADVGGTEIAFFNVQGIIFYTDQTDEADELEENVKDKSSAEEELERLDEQTAEGEEAEADEAGDEVDAIEEQAEAQVKDVALSDEADLGSELAIDTLDGTMGAV